MDLHDMFRLANDPLTPPDILADLASSDHEKIGHVFNVVIIITPSNAHAQFSVCRACL